MNCLTVAELIELLKKQPLDAKVITEGCDCYGEATAVEYNNSENIVIIKR